MRRSGDPTPPSVARRTATCAATVLLLSAAVFASTQARADGPPCGTALAIEAVLQRLNEVRGQSRHCGAEVAAPTGPTLVWNEALASAAKQQSIEMARLRRMSHRDGANRELAERLRAQGYRFASAVENVAVGYGSLDAVVEAWLESDGHCRNLMNGEVLELGIACVDGVGMGASAAASEEQRYWTLVLAAPPRAAKARETIDVSLTARHDPPPTPSR